MKSSPTSKALQQARGPSGPPGAFADLQHRAHEAAAMLKVLANPDRLMLLCHLLGGERPVAGLAGITGITQPTLS